MSDLTQFAIILAVAAGLFFGLGVYFAGGRKREEPTSPAPESEPLTKPSPELSGLRSELEGAKNHARALEEDLARARAQLQSVDGVAPNPTMGTEIDPDLGAVYSVRPEAADDLTKIRGIGAALARQLNALGVYTLAQIGAWEKSQIDAISARLSFKDRIVRDDWVGQARRLNS